MPGIVNGLSRAVCGIGTGLGGCTEKPELGVLGVSTSPMITHVVSK